MIQHPPETESPTLKKDAGRSCKRREKHLLHVVTTPTTIVTRNVYFITIIKIQGKLSNEIPRRKVILKRIKEKVPNIGTRLAKVRATFRISIKIVMKFHVPYKQNILLYLNI